MDVIYHYLFRMSVSCTSTVDCIGKQFITQGCFFGADLFDVSSSPFPCVDDGGPSQLHQVWQHVCPQCQNCGTLHANGLSWNSYCRWHSMQDSCHSQGSVSRYSWGTVGYTSMVCSSEVDGCGRGHGWPCQHTSQPLPIQWHNMCN